MQGEDVKDAWKNLQHIAIGAGFDAILVHDDGEGVGKGLDVIVFGADQVKSLHNNSGLFLSGSLSVSDAQQAVEIERALKASQSVVESIPEETLTKDDLSVDGVLSLLSRVDSSLLSNTSGGNCGMFAMALARVAGADSFVFVENEAEPGMLYHVAIKKDGVYIDGSGVVTEEALLTRGYDEIDANSTPKIIEVQASEAFFQKYIRNGTSPDVNVIEWEGILRSALSTPKIKP